MVLVYGPGGLVSVPPPPISQSTPPPLNFRGTLGQMYIDTSANPANIYYWTGLSWQLGAVNNSPTFSGTVTAGTGFVATTGGFTATNGNLTLGTAGNKIIIATGANASVGTTAAMTAGAITQATTASSATAKVFYSRATTGGTPGDVSITAQDGTGFTLTSTSNSETSTFNWWIINA